MKVAFKAYMHDGYSSYERAHSILEQIDLTEYPDVAAMTLDEFVEFLGRPFYEITLKCELDTETGKVEVIETVL